MDSNVTYKRSKIDMANYVSKIQGHLTYLPFPDYRPVNSVHGGGNAIAIHLKRYCLNHISPHLFSLQDTLECSSSRLNPPSGYAFTPDRRLESFVHNPHNHGLFHNSDLLLACERSHVLGKQQCRCNQRRSLILACRQLSDALYRSCEQGHPSPLVTPGYRPSHPARFRSRPGGGMCEPARLYRRSDGNVRCRHAEVRRQFERHSLHSLPEYVVPRLAGAYLGCAKCSAVFTKLASQLTADKLGELAVIPVIFAVQTLVSYLCSVGMAKVFRFKKRPRNFVIAMGVSLCVSAPR